MDRTDETLPPSPSDGQLPSQPRNQRPERRHPAQQARCGWTSGEPMPRVPPACESQRGSRSDLVFTRVRATRIYTTSSAVGTCQIGARFGAMPGDSGLDIFGNCAILPVFTVRPSRGAPPVAQQSRRSTWNRTRASRLHPPLLCGGQRVGYRPGRPAAIPRSSVRIVPGQTPGLYVVGRQWPDGCAGPSVRRRLTGPNALWPDRHALERSGENAAGRSACRPRRGCTSTPQRYLAYSPNHIESTSQHL